MNKERTNLLIIIFIAITMVLLGYNAFLIKGDGFQCLQNPLVFGINQFAEQYDFNPVGRIFGTTNNGIVDINFNTTSMSIRRTSLP